MRIRVLVLVLIALALGTGIALARESWPVPPPEVKARVDGYDKYENQLIEKLKPQIEEWGKKGKPYIPWAAKPEDLPQAKVPAFPGAEGGGMYSFGGRGGKVYVVTSLEDSGPGTFREACEAAGPRIIVFNVAGIIHLKMPVFIEAPYITIDGQTAPGDGVCIADQGIVDNAHDVIIRYLRLRRGSTDIYYRHGVHYGNPVGNIMLDHLSASWGIDQNLDTYRHMYQPPEGGPAKKLPAVNVTIQWCISSEALNTWNHGFGGDWGGRNSMFHHNLLACNTGRNPSIAMTYDFNFVNNVLFNWRHRTVDGGGEESLLNIINNYYKPGPVTPQAPISYRIVQPSASWSKSNPVSRWGKAYVAGNYVDGNERVTADNWNGGVQFSLAPDPDANGGIAKGPVKDEARIAEIISKVKVDKPLPMPPVKIESAQEAYEAVLANAGATLPKRDAVDARVMEEVRTGKTWGMGKEMPIDPPPGLAKNNIGVAGNGIITDIKQVGGYPEYKGQPNPDIGPDGIARSWKTKYGLDANDAELARKDLKGDGYTVVEKYLYGMDPTKKFAPAEAVSAAKNESDAEAKYTQAIEKRADDVVKALALQDSARASRVHNSIVAQYRALRDWHAANDPKLKKASKEQAAEIKTSLHALHDQFIATLSRDLDAGLVEKVKDRMTYDKVKVTYDGYLQIVKNLTEQEKAKIMEFLKQAREEAMDAGSSEEKSAIFKAAKGKINNYLNKSGHNTAQDYKEWGQQQKEKQQVAKAATKPAQ